MLLLGGHLQEVGFPILSHGELYTRITWSLFHEWRWHVEARVKRARAWILNRIHAFT